MNFTNNKGTKLGTMLDNGLPFNNEQTPMRCRTTSITVFLMDIMIAYHEKKLL